MYMESRANSISHFSIWLDKMENIFKDKANILLLTFPPLSRDMKPAFIDIQTRNNPSTGFPREDVYYTLLTARLKIRSLVTMIPLFG